MPVTSTGPSTRTAWRVSSTPGACAPPAPSARTVVPGALLVFEAESADKLAALLDQDPFRREGLIAERTIRDWQIFFGGVK